jgi:hypothetical protein
MERNPNQMRRLQIPLEGLRYGKIAKHSNAKLDAKTTETSAAQANMHQQRSQARKPFRGSEK